MYYSLVAIYTTLYICVNIIKFSAAISRFTLHAHNNRRGYSHCFLSLVVPVILAWYTPVCAITSCRNYHDYHNSSHSNDCLRESSHKKHLPKNYDDRYCTNYCFGWASSMDIQHQAKLLLDFVYSPTNNGGFEIDSKSPTQDLISRSSRNNPATRLWLKYDPTTSVRIWVEDFNKATCDRSRQVRLESHSTYIPTKIKQPLLAITAIIWLIIINHTSIGYIISTSTPYIDYPQ